MSFALRFFDSADAAGARQCAVTALLPASAKGFLRDRASEIAGIGLAGLAGTALVATISYAPSDASLNSAADGPTVNLLGPAGAVAADLLVQGFGYAAYLLIFGIAGWAWRLFRKRALPHPLWRGLALVLAAVAAGIGLSALPVSADWPLATRMGGVAGTLVHDRIALLLASFGWAGLAPHVSALAAFLGVLLWVYGLGLTWREWRASGLALGAGALLLSRGVKKGRDAIGVVPAWGRRWIETDAPPDTHGHMGEASDADPDAGVNVRVAVGDSEDDAPEAPKRTGLVAPRKPKPKTGRKAKAARQGKLDLEPGAEYTPPPLDLLETPVVQPGKDALNKDTLEQNAKFLATVLQDFGIKGEIVKVRPGPVVTLYELEPAPGTKTSRVIGLSDDIARSMSAVSVRVAVVPGRNVIGIELPNVDREMVYLRELLASADFEKSKAKLPLALGKDIGGGGVAVDLARMPHLLIAGTTGSGKSVAMNTMILSLLYSLSPTECKLIMIDPKMLELSVYEGIPHLLTPVVTDPSKAVVALKWAVREMEDRYRNMSQLGVRNIAGYNARIEEARKKGEQLTRRVQTGFDEAGKPVMEDQPLPMDPLPFIVVVVDEMADLMLVAGKDVEAAIQRLAQMARAAGIHLIMATQRPSVDVITGTVKANFPTRVSFQVTSKIDSRTILGEQGAEQLLGQGDMLYMAGGGRITRVHGPFVSDDEVEHIVNHLKAQGAPAYIEEVTVEDEIESPAGGGGNGDALYDEAVALVAREGRASTSFIQRHLQIGYNRAARIIEQMEKEGVVSPANRVGRREVLVGAH